MNKTNVIISGEWQKVMQKAVRWPCGVCGRGVGNNSIQFTQKWVHRKYTGMKGSIGWRGGLVVSVLDQRP